MDAINNGDLARAADHQVITELFSPLYAEFRRDQTFPNKRPLLAHYTSIQNLERILSTEELWFSNPLLMNDLEELRFGVLEGTQRFLNNPAVGEACGSSLRAQLLFESFEKYFKDFDSRTAFDVYALCLSEHEKEDMDGVLSMWRGYGGNGSGAAMVFDTAKINALGTSPLVISAVEYAGTEDRLAFLDKKVNEFEEIVRANRLEDRQLASAAWVMFERIRLFALFTKHRGFAEEREWRIVYLQERDPGRKMASMLQYAVSERGLEPRLKFKVTHHEGLTAADLSLTKIIDRIILGPAAASFISRGTLHRVLEATGKEALKDRVVASSIPFRHK